MPGQDLVLNFKVNDQGSAALQKMQSSIGGIQTAINAVNPAAFVYLGQQVVAATEKIFAFVEAGAKIQSTVASFDIVTRSSGIMADSLISNLQKATNSTVASSALMTKANRLMLEGFSSDQIVVIGEAARVAARIMGTDVSDAYDHVADSIVNLRERGLKTAGFVIDLDAAYTKHATTLGRTKEQLNDYGKQMAIMEAVQEKTIELQKKLGMEMETTSERIQQQKSGWKEFYENVGKAASEAWDLVHVLGALAVSKLPKAPPWAWGGEEGGPYSELQTKFFAGGEEHGQAGRAGAMVPAKSQIKIDPDNPFLIEGFSLKKMEEALRKAQTMAKAASTFGMGWGAEEGIGVKPGEMMIEGMTIKTRDYETSLKALDDAYMKTIDLQEISGPTQEQANAITLRSITLGNERIASILDLTKQYADLTDNLQLAIETDKAMEDEYLRINNLTAQQIQLIQSLGNERRFQLANKEIVDATTSVAQSMSSAWSSGLMDMINRTKTFGDAMKGIITDMGNIIIKKLLEISMNYMLMGNITGTKITGGLFGSVGKLLGIGGGGGGGGGGGTIAAAGSFETGFEMLQHGTSYVPRTGFALLHQGEAVIPADQNKGKGDTYNYSTFIQATDVGSFAKLYGPTIESIYWKGKRFNKVSMRNQ